MDTSDKRRVRAMAPQWLAVGLTPNEIRRWREVGAEIDEADLVKALRDEGLSAERCQVVFRHPASGDWLTCFDLARESHSRAALARALAAAGVIHPGRQAGRRGA